MGSKNIKMSSKSKLGLYKAIFLLGLGWLSHNFYFPDQLAYVLHDIMKVSHWENDAVEKKRDVVEN